MKRLLALVAVTIGLAGVLTGLRAQVSTEAVAKRLAGVLVPFGDRAPDVTGDVSVRVFPRLSVVFDKLRIAATHGATLDAPDLIADRVTADIDVLPLFIGETSVSELTLDHPRLSIETALDLAGLTPDRRVLDHMLPASVVIRQGELHVWSAGGVRDETVRSINATLRWPRALGNLSLDGTANWRGERVALSLQGIAPPRLAKGETGALDLTLRMGDAKLTFAGTAALSDCLQLDGALSATATSPEQLRRLALDTGSSPQPNQPSFPFPPVEIAGQWKSQGWSGSLAAARISVGSAVADGVLSTRIDLPRPQLRGTLAIGDIDLTAAVAALRTPSWSEMALGTAGDVSFDLDLRLSVNEAEIAGTKLTNLAASLLVADGQFHADIGDIDVFGGTGTASVHGVFEPSGLKASGHATLTGASMAALRSGLAVDAVPMLAGPVSITADLDTAADTLFGVLDQAHVRLETQAKQLIVDVPPTGTVGFEAAPASSTETAARAIFGTPEIDGLIANLIYADHAITIEKLAFATQDRAVDIHGSADLAARTLDLAGVATALPRPTRRGLPHPVLAFRLTGPVDRPDVIVTPSQADKPTDPVLKTNSVPTTH